MSNHLLNRKDAPFDQKTWDHMDSTVIAAAKSQLSVRRIVELEGPYGLGLRAVPGADEEIPAKGAQGASLYAASAIPLAGIVARFFVSARDIASLEATGLPFDASAAASAGMSCAMQEESILLYGADALGTSGLLTAKGTSSMKLHSWKMVGTAADDIIAAVTRLDESGFHGPYALALAPALYNLLFRRYEQGQMTELEHLKSIVTDGLVKSPSLKAGGALLASGRQFTSIVVGQDITVGFVGPAAGGYDLTVSESVALRMRRPGAVCVLKGE